MIDQNDLLRLSYLDPAAADYIGSLYEEYLQDPRSVDPSWQYLFDGYHLGEETHVSSSSTPEASNGHGNLNIRSVADLDDEAKVAELITRYRSRGWLLAHLDPLTSEAPTSHPILELQQFGLTEAHLSRSFSAASMLGMPASPLSGIIARLKQVYCRTIGIQYVHIQDPKIRQWIQDRMRPVGNLENLSNDHRKQILKRLTQAETFERFLHTRFVAQKRFSLEGGEALIPGLDRIIEAGAELGAEQFVVGMAHRGRLNVLANVFQKEPQYIFTEFAQEYQRDERMGEGDVKYHMGFSADIATSSGRSVHLSLAHNPSHLEFVNPVVAGVTRGKQRYLKDQDRSKVVPIVIHGDAAVAGQGVVYETLNLAHVEGYDVGGTLHIVINNQVGFTTDPKASRSTTHPTDVAMMLEVPVLHVNGDDVESVYYACKLAMEFRQTFKKDVFIDLVCYRKYGHNEGDEPAFTQPLMYKKIKSHPSPRAIYEKSLVEQKVIQPEEAKTLVDQQMDILQKDLEKTRSEKPKPFVSAYQSIWKKFHQATEKDIFSEVKTQWPREKLVQLSKKLTTPSLFC